MSFWTYEKVLHAQQAWLKAQKDLPPEKDGATAKDGTKAVPRGEVPKIRSDGFGPQM